MKANTFEYPKSSFLGMTKDTALIMDKLLKNPRILRLLYYNTPDCLELDKKPTPGSKEIKEMLKKQQIGLIPSVTTDKEKLSYLRVYFDDFSRTEDNDFYRDSSIEVRIICHFDTWQLENMELRPYRLAGEIDSMLDGARFSGIGELRFVHATQDVNVTPPNSQS